MDDELEWLRNAEPPTEGLGDLARRHIRARLLAAATAATTDADELEPLPVAGATPIDVLDTETNGPERSEPGRRDRRVLLGAAAALLLLIGAASLFGDNGDDDAEPEEDADTPWTDPSPTSTAVPSTTTTPPSPTVRATPTDALRDADVVAVTAIGFEPRAELELAVCVTLSSTIGGCDRTTLASVEADRHGSIDTRVAVPRTILVDGSPLDCAVVTCALTVAATTEPEIVELAPLRFDPTPEPPPSATIAALDEPVALVDGQHVDVGGEGFGPGAWVSVLQCVVELDERVPNCREPVAATTTIADGEGRIETSVRLSRLLPTEEGWLDCAGLDEGRCVLLADTVASPEGPRARRVAPAVDLPYDPEAPLVPAGLVVDHPLEGLADGSAVPVSVTASVGRLPVPPEAALCRAGADTVCVGVPIARFADGGRSIEATLVLPRAFRTDDGDEHDCLETGPCVLVLGPESQQGAYGLSFDPALPQRGPVTPTILEEGPYTPGQYLTVDLPLGTEVWASQCVSDAVGDVCEGYGVETDGYFADAYSPIFADGRLRIRVFRRMETQLGGHDCVADGPCELRFFAPFGDSPVRSVPLTFDPALAPLEGPTVAVTPTTDLGDGSEVAVTIGELGPGAVVRVRLCPLAALPVRDCPSVHVDEADADGHVDVRLRLPRRLTGRWDPESPDLSATDCAAEPCVVRVTHDRFRTDTVVSFDPDLPRLPDPSLELLTTGPVEPRERVRLEAAGFVPVGPDEPSGVRWALCDRRPTDVVDIGDRCGPTSVPGGLVLDADGAVTGSVTIPAADLETEAGRPLDCSDECWLVVVAGIFETIAVAPIDLAPG